MCRLKVIFMLTFASLPCAVWAEPRWVQVAETENYFVRVDVSSIKINNNTVRFWVSNIVKSDSDAYKIGARESIILQEHNCETEQSRNLQITVYEKGESKAVTVSGRWSYIIPGSAGQSLFDFVCNNDK